MALTNLRLIAAAVLVVGTAGGIFAGEAVPSFAFEPEPMLTDSLDREILIIDADTIHTSFLPPQPERDHSGPLTVDDYAEIAQELGVEPAAIRAVVEIETGSTRRGFSADSLAVINFDLPVFRRVAARRGINLDDYTTSHPAVFAKPDIARYGTQQRAQHARLDAAMSIDSIAAIESTFWGMFQIGGFNWKLCGASSRSEFVQLMQKSEYDQLRLFANFISNTGLLRPLKEKNWAEFAKRYNGPSYASRRYHTRMAAAYRRYLMEQ